MITQSLKIKNGQLLNVMQTKCTCIFCHFLLLHLQNNFELLEAEHKADLSNIIPFNYNAKKKAM